MLANSREELVEVFDAL
ncbi:13E12 repeat family protein, partial [Mycobacterium tuberculosis MD17973]